MNLRIEYSIFSHVFDALDMHILNHKSVENTDVIYEAASREDCSDGEEHLDLGPCRGRFKIHAIPLYAEHGELGPRGEKTVVAIIERRGVGPKSRLEAKPLFD